MLRKLGRRCIPGELDNWLPFFFSSVSASLLAGRRPGGRCRGMLEHGPFLGTLLFKELLMVYERV